MITVPAHTVVDEAAMLTVGVVLTFTFTVLVAVHPAAFMPVSVYCVVTVGDTATVLPVKAPGFHV